MDPGIGFGKSDRHNLELLRDLANLIPHGERLLVGVSRKRLIGEIHALSDQNGVKIATNDRREGSMVCSVWSWLRGAHIVRVHDVRTAALAMHYLRMWSDVDQDG